MDKFKSRNLADYAADELRRRIIRGEIELGRKITEREVSEILDIGRMPAREALMALEHEGLIVNNSESRSVLRLDEKDVIGLYELRGILEVLAVAQAALNTSPERAIRLEERLNSLRFGCERQDSSLTTPADLALHEEIWAQSNNKYLERCLRSIRGAVFVLVMRGSTFGERNWTGLYQVHAAVVRSINRGNVEDSILYMRKSLADASQHSIEVERQLSEE
jgi:DNA-binding GntR family transcriptional regulator